MKDAIYQPLEGLSHILQAKRQAEELEKAKGEMITVFGISAYAMGIWRNSQTRWITENACIPAKMALQSWM